MYRVTAIVPAGNLQNALDGIHYIGRELTSKVSVVSADFDDNGVTATIAIRINGTAGAMEGLVPELLWHSNDVHIIKEA